MTSQLFTRWKLLTFCFLANIALHLPYAVTIQMRYGIDTSAYLNQAGQVYLGQRDYTKLETVQGPCYYPAGHLWLYYPFYVLFTNSENAEFYFRAVHVVMHSIQNAVVSCVAF
jgi:hypothetical protein